MLKVLLVLSIVGLVLSFILNIFARGKKINGMYLVLSLLQGACLGAMVGLLVILLIKGRTLV
ncbi:hypothetical protein [Enterococcus malodoratus]|uniref:Uncharacterized protein n=1 Tax=Enterococcus malodoratus ATCC 43197 TaxID=1158601 RepID=R2NLY1_9ENTE|nr:hypothetical protein [Enterococcus malodoratus]BBM19442.1 hypothetical protein G15_3122 [Enterococcus avium]EOH71968.1 hypothetical protein UAI_04252 [Enterococcus malodoratus ATCC 43197]EOT70008.1 hypothetical protein I585_01487 [Enterococcus malodoratus ATCC 43197]OJG66211.1 hypothetical protein RV07_GL000004 [Enterococcus malodoratus]SET09883.1 hypothetical protein SAMN04487821_10634 [Enterococcus malodoratus]